MGDLLWLNDAQMARPAPYCPRPHGKPRVDGKRVPSGIIVINCNRQNGAMPPKPIARTVEGDRGAGGAAKAPGTL